MKQLFTSCLNSYPYFPVAQISSWINFLCPFVICLIFVHLLDPLNLSNITLETILSNNYDRPKTTGECGMF